MRVVVTGGSGFVGNRIRKVKPHWIYLSSKDYDLVSASECKKMYKELQPDAVVHLAGKIGGIIANDTSPADFYYLNTMMNTNIIHEGYLAGVDRILAALSTCAFPDVVDKYPFGEEDIFKGPPASTNLSYGCAKRSLYVQIKSYRKQYGVNYSAFCPANVYGPGDNFNSLESHFVAALVSKVAAALDGDTIELWGTGTPLRQQLYVDDLCEIIPILLEKHNGDSPLIVAPDENISIDSISKILISQLDKDIKVSYNNKLDGQFRKDGSNSRLSGIIGDYKFTKIKEGILSTYNSYKEKGNDF
jgi:GDP-L-fucose synthase